jgi:TusE/DsrC/DsvC family sulfur relay protein
MNAEARRQQIRVDREGFLADPRDWTEGFATTAASQDGLNLTEAHWELIQYFRTYYQEHERHPDMNTLAQTLGRSHGEGFQDQREYRDYLYSLFPVRPGPIVELCKLAGLPKPLEDVY